MRVSLSRTFASRVPSNARNSAGQDAPWQVEFGAARGVRGRHRLLHLDKHHWDTVVLDGSVLNDLLREWIVDPYGLVAAGLTRAARSTLG